MKNAKTWRLGRAASIFVTLAIAGAVLFFRFPDALLNPQLFAEGGTVFFAGAYELGRDAILVPYKGYLILVPRLIAWVAMHFDPRWTPAIYNSSAFAIEILVLAFVFSPRVRLPIKPAIVLAVALVPHTDEVVNSFINIQWWLALALILVLVSEDAGDWKRSLFDLAIVGFCGLTGPFIAFLLPVFVLRAWFRKSRDSALITCWAALTAAVQIHFLIAEWTASGAREGLTSRGWEGILSIFSARIFGTYWRGYGLPLIGPSFAWIGAGTALVALGLYFVLKPGAFAFQRKILFCALVCLILPIWFKFTKDFGVFAAARNGDRYFFLSHVLIGWILVLTFAMQKGWLRLIPVAAAVVALAANSPCFYQPALPDLHWKHYLQPIRAGKGFSIPINPEPWEMKSAGKKSWNR